MPPLILVLLASIIYTPQLIYLEIRKSGLRLKYNCFEVRSNLDDNFNLLQVGPDSVDEII